MMVMVLPLLLSALRWYPLRMARSFSSIAIASLALATLLRCAGAACGLHMASRRRGDRELALLRVLLGSSWQVRRRWVSVAVVGAMQLLQCLLPELLERGVMQVHPRHARQGAAASCFWPNFNVSQK